MHPTDFKDHFSSAPGDYRACRPGYPPRLFAHLASLAPAHELAWDCATGNGQAACMLNAHFRRVIATDASEAQILENMKAERVEYRTLPAEHTDIPAGSVDLVTVAQALHWFDIPAFFREAQRVLKPDGVLACWCYNLLTISPAVDRIVNRLYSDILGPFWPPERALVESAYRDIPFPFRPLESPELAMQTLWTLDQVTGYLRTWSATRAFENARGEDPVAMIADALADAWGPASRSRPVSWPLSVRIGRVDH